MTDYAKYQIAHFFVIVLRQNMLFCIAIIQNVLQYIIFHVVVVVAENNKPIEL